MIQPHRPLPKPGRDHCREQSFRNAIRALLVLVVSGSCGSATPVAAQNTPAEPVETARNQRVDFARDVYPILRRACFECHGAERQEADLRLDLKSSTFESYAVVPREPDNSELLRRMTLPAGHEEVMPAVGNRLPQREVSTIRRWIEQGAPWPDSFEVARHWAYVQPVRPAVDLRTIKGQVRNEIDVFVLRKLREQGLHPSPRAEPEVLLRRIYLDLIGLPPSPGEVDAFLRDPGDAALEQIVDDLLSRPQFGERWARPWLDLARYADSHGFQRDNLREIWAYRDWVIRALNDDMPFDQFTIEQIAGDLLPDATESQRIATGFHRCTPTNVEAGSLPEETRIEQVIDRVNTTGAVWLGTTLECAQCHDHKYDPFSSRDYYRLLAFFNSTELEADRTNPKSPSSIAFRGPSMPLSDADRDARRKTLETQRSRVRADQARRRGELADSLDDFAAIMRANASESPQTHTLRIVGFESEGTTDAHEVLADGSVLLIGNDPPSTDEYTVRATVNLKGIRALRLDALTHESLPGSGPGRGDARKTNFILNEFKAFVQPAMSDPAGPNASSPKPALRPLGFASAQADFSQKSWDVTAAIDGNRKTGWAIAPEFGKDHWAQFRLESPLDLDETVELVVKLDQQFGQARTIGRFRLQAVTGSLDAESVPAYVLGTVRKDATEWTDKERQTLLDYRARQDDEFSQLQAEIDRLSKQIEGLNPDTTLVMIELDQPRPGFMFERGDYRKPGDPVTPGTPSVLHASPTGPPNRLTLARWLVDPANPLVARVTVNRWWAELFGRGIVATPEDFGIKGDPPTHPDLLDWLAVELMENNWSMKHVLRTIVLSATYQQSSRSTPAQIADDSLNQWLGRGPRFRMDAEMIRDNALAISGLLSLKQFGPSIYPWQPDGIWSKVGGTAYKYEVSPGTEQHRRGIYVVLKRGAPYPSFVNFDASARLACTVQRSRTNTPLQALTLLNDPVYVEAAKALARRVIEHPLQSSSEPDAPGERLVLAWRLCTARRPSSTEQRLLRELYEDQLKVASSQPEVSRRLTAGISLPQNVSAAEFSAWYSVASVLLNMHETITKQ